MSANFYYSRIRYELTDSGLRVAFARSVPYRGSWGFCKGDATAKQAESQQNAFNQQLMSIFQQQYGKQSAVLDFLTNKLKPMIDNPTGYSPEALAAMRTSATDTLSNTYQNAQKALQGKEFTQGGRDLPSGVNDQIDSALLSSEARDKGNAQNTITLNDENLKQSNLWNAMNVLSGNVAQQFNPLGYAGQATSGSNAVANLSEANTQANSSGFFGSLSKSLGSGLGGLLTGGNSTGGSGVGAFFGVCHVAASLFGGWNTYKTRMCRFWMANLAPKWLRSFYTKHSPWIAETPLRWAFYPVFQYALRIS